MRRVRSGSLPDRPPRLGRSKHRERCQPPSIPIIGTGNADSRAGSQSRAAGTFPAALSARHAAYGAGVALCRPSAPQPPKLTDSTRPPRTYEILRVQSLLRRLPSRIGRTALAGLERLRCGGSAQGLPRTARRVWGAQSTGKGASRPRLRPGALTLIRVPGRIPRRLAPFPLC